MVEEEEEDYHPTRRDEIKKKYGEQRCALSIHDGRESRFAGSAVVLLRVEVLSTGHMRHCCSF